MNAILILIAVCSALVSAFLAFASVRDSGMRLRVLVPIAVFGAFAAIALAKALGQVNPGPWMFQVVVATTGANVCLVFFVLFRSKVR
ncbi:hypothetical protein Enr13x_49380 [Stieleria neptunia]|uniref:Uncharacterized protein n=1 Tax=Stieleria neptunia TaxID=2527979 RepID=A0A518HW39_9BACT|nr:hypothetical protein [Stieleria neptunia]QDV45065.1 hypothetical protein Enr13x_49380 [Stieleria neptunia]